MNFKNISLIKHKKSGRVYRVLGSEGANMVLLCKETLKRFTQAQFAIDRDYENYNESDRHNKKLLGNK